MSYVTMHCIPNICVCMYEQKLRDSSLGNLFTGRQTFLFMQSLYLIIRLAKILEFMNQIHYYPLACD